MDQHDIAGAASAAPVSVEPFLPAERRACPEPGRRACPEPGRRDAFTGEMMARFCEVLAETGIVTEACRAVGISRDTAYAHRRRNPLFAAAWAAALSHARNRLADALLARSIEGSVDYIYRDGELVGERRYIDNRLAYSMLRRLDKQAEAVPAPVAAELSRPKPTPAKPDWDLALKALRTGSEEDLCAALALFDPESDSESDKTDNPPDPAFELVGFDPAAAFGTKRVWEDEDENWWTNFPPPADFFGEERGRWDEADYERECTPEECEALDDARDAALAELRKAEESERDSFFDSIRRQTGAREPALSAPSSARGSAEAAPSTPRITRP